MRRGLTFLSLLLVAFCLLFDLRSTSVSNATSSDGEEFVAREVVVKLASAADLPAIAARYSLDPTPDRSVWQQADFQIADYGQCFCRGSRRGIVR